MGLLRVIWIVMSIFCGGSVVVAQLTAEQHFERVMKNPNIQVEEQVTGEGFCWHAAYAADDFVTGYLAYGDTAWLDQSVKGFDETVRTLYERTLNPGTIAHAHYYNVTAKEALGFERKYVTDANGYKIAFSDCGNLTMVGVLPSTFAPGQSTMLVSKTAEGGTLVVAVYREDGERIAVLYDNTMMGGTDSVKRIFMMPWDGTDALGKPVDKKRFIIRWTLNDAYRETSVWVN